MPEPRDQLLREDERAAYAPNAIHLLSMLVNKCRNGIWRAIVLINFDETVIALLEFMRSWAT